MGHLQNNTLDDVKNNKMSAFGEFLFLMFMIVLVIIVSPIAMINGLYQCLNSPLSDEGVYSFLVFSGLIFVIIAFIWLFTTT